ncbi:hypothetical protein Tco_0841530 [Tanacetum coccineum]|uniref:Retrovirus-related Pol polyprotein from transposon TNT 1-94-like beta-barrel domain-containing protein n=1 Tax=Tanacetum coccineum TaxID=301880 RepID=A0ABQ5B0I6_9ASTR
MSTLQFAETYNMIAFLEKPAESNGFQEIIDFLNANQIHYALTVNPNIYTSCIEQFWATAKVKMINGERQLQALVDKKKVIITETSIRSDLHLEDAGGTDCLPTATIFEDLARMCSLSQDVYLCHVFSDNAETARKELKETYDRIDESIVFNLEFDILTKLPNCTCAARIELVDHGKLLKLTQFLMGPDDIYQPITSNILTREILSEVKDAFVIVSKEESHRGIPPSTVKTDKPQVSTFVSRKNNNNRNINNNWSNNGNNVNKGSYDNLLCKNYGLKGHTIDRCFEIIGYPPDFKRNLNFKPTNSINNNKSNNVDFKKGILGNNDSKTSGNVSFTNEQVMKLMGILNDKHFSTGQVNMAVNYHLGWIIDLGANQHMTNSTKDMIDLVDMIDLKLTVGHPNRTLAKITHVGNLRLNNDVIFFNVLMIPEYTVSLLSIYKLIKDSKLSVGFDETKCYIQD